MGEEKEKPKNEEKKKEDKKDEKKVLDAKDKDTKEKEKKEDGKKGDPKDVKEKDKDPKPKDGKEAETPAGDAKHSDAKDLKNSTTPQNNKSPAEKEKKKDDEKPARKKLQKGMVVKTVKHAFKIENIIGAGGFGEVYKVSLLDKPAVLYAMKIEHNSDGTFNRLKMETMVLEEAKKNSSVTDCYAKLIDKGTTPKFRFIVMELVSHSLRDIYREICKSKMPKHSAIYLVKETLKAVTGLHELGFLHRDVKPHNFAVGIVPADRKVYMLDFGIARRYMDEKKQYLVPRAKVPFIGTTKYASRACHKEKEQFIKDDLESWLYMCLELFGELEWHKISADKNRKEVEQMKHSFYIKVTTESKGTTPQLFVDIYRRLDKMHFTHSIVDTDIEKMIEYAWQDVLKEEKLDEKSPLVWEGKTLPERKSKATRKKESMAKIKKIEEELLKMLDDGEATEDKKEEVRRMAREKHRRSSDQRRRRSGGRKRRGTMDEEDDLDDEEDYEDDEESYDERDERDRPRKKESNNRRGRGRDDEPRGGRKRDLRKRTSRLTSDDDPRDRRRSSQIKRKNSRKKRNSSRRRHRGMDDDRMKMEDSPPRDNGRGSGKRDTEKGASAEKIDDVDGPRKDSGKRSKEGGGTPIEGSKDKLTSSAEPSPSATPIEHSDKDKKKK